MKLKWTERALRQLIHAQDYIARDNPAAAQAVAQRIADASRLLPVQPWIGRPGRIDGTREWVVKQTPLAWRDCHRYQRVAAVPVVG